MIWQSDVRLQLRPMTFAHADQQVTSPRKTMKHKGKASRLAGFHRALLIKEGFFLEDAALQRLTD
jgi:hypothetical protein